MPRSVQSLVRIFSLSCVCDLAFLPNAQRPSVNAPLFISSPQSGIQTSAFHRSMPRTYFLPPSPLFSSLLPSSSFSPALYLLPPTVTCSAPSYVLPTLKNLYSIYSGAIRPSPCSTTDKDVICQCKTVLGFGLCVQPSEVVHGSVATPSLSK